MKKLWIPAVVVLTTAFASATLVQDEAGQDQAEAAQEAAQAAPASDGQVQPIQFAHDVHAGTYQMECTYCHFSAERSVDAGIPPVESCMGCHALVGGATPEQQTEIQKLRDYYNRGEPIPWTRIYKISDHAHFPHFRHVNAGLDCTECHGQVQEMGVIEARDPVWGGDNMGWCISCHVQEDVTRDCTTCHY